MAVSPQAHAITGVYQGCWTDYDGNNYCGDDSPSSSGSSYSSGSYDYSGAYAAGQAIGQAISNVFTAAAEAQAQAAAQRRQALDLNLQGNSYLKSGDWAQAISYYEQALTYSPYDLVIKKNLKRAKSGKLNKQGVDAHDSGDWKTALYYYRQSLALDPGDHTVIKNMQMAKKMRSRDLVRGKQARMNEQMAEASAQIQQKIDQVVSDLKPPPESVDLKFQSAKALTSDAFNPNRGKGLKIKKDIPSPAPLKPEYEDPYQLELFRDAPYWKRRAVEAANFASRAYHDSKIKFKKDVIKKGKEAIKGEIKKRSRAFTVMSNIHDETKQLYEKMMGEHGETTVGLFEGISQGAAEMGSLDVTGNADEQMEAFWKRRGQSYQKFTADQAKITVEKGLAGRFGKEPTREEKSTTTPLLGLKSYDRQRQENLNRMARQ